MVGSLQQSITVAQIIRQRLVEQGVRANVTAMLRPEGPAVHVTLLDATPDTADQVSSYTRAFERGHASDGAAQVQRVRVTTGRTSPAAA